MHHAHESQDLAGRTYVVTGATSGIGLEAALALARRGAAVVGVARDASRVPPPAELAGGGSLRYELADLSSRRQVRALGERLARTLPRLDALVNDAGTFSSWRVLTEDGFELQLQVNHLAGFALTAHLLPLLAQSRGRVVNVSSGSHRQGRLHLDDLQLTDRYGGLAAYARSKLANVLFTYELARRVAPERVTVHAVDPGLVATEMGYKHAGPLARAVWFFRRRAGTTPAEGAATPVFVATAPEAGRRTGLYWRALAPERSSPRSYDLEDARRLFAASEALTGVRYDGILAGLGRAAEAVA